MLKREGLDPQRCLTILKSGLRYFCLSEPHKEKKKVAMSMNFLEDTDDWPEYDIIKDDIRRLETEHAALRKELKQAESALRSDPENEDLNTRADGLKKKLKEISKHFLSLQRWVDSYSMITS